MTDRLFRGDDRERDRSERTVFDPIVEGNRFGLSAETSLLVWRHVRSEATTHLGVCDEKLARARFGELARRVAGQGGRLGPPPGKSTQVEAAARGAVARYGITEAVPGKTTRVLAPGADRARFARSMAPGRTTRVPDNDQPVEYTVADARAFSRRYLSGGKAALTELARAIASHERHAALLATNALRRDLRCARTHLDSARDEQLNEEVVVLERSADQLLASVPADWNITTTANGGELAGAQAHDRARSAPGSPVETDRGRLPARMLEQMERAFGERFDGVEIHAESAAVPSGQQALTRDQQIYLEPGAVDLETPHGQRVIAHELAHVVQQRDGGRPAGTRRELEREATRAAALATSGQTARIALRAQPAVAYAFSEEGEHEGAEESPSTEPGDARKTHASSSSTGQAGNVHDASLDSHAQHDEAATTPTSGSTVHHGDAAGETSARVQDVSSVVPEEGNPLAAPASVGNGATARPSKEPPSVAAARPEEGLAQLRGVRPDRLGPALGQVRTAASAYVAEARATLHANNPKYMSTGTATGSLTGAAQRAAPMLPASNPAPADATLAATAAAPKEKAERPVKAEVPQADAAKQAVQDTATVQQKTAGEIVTAVAHTIASWFNSWFGHADDARTAKVSDEERRQLSGSVDRLPTTADGVSTDPGPAPELAMRGEAQASADRDRAAFETKVTTLENESRTDSREPMGEDQIEPASQAVGLSAMAAASTQPAAAPIVLPTLASAPSEEVGIVAHEQHGAEIDAAISKASTDITVERSRRVEEDARLRAESDAEIRDLETTADADRAAARDAAQAEVQDARGQWQSEIDAQGADARKQADRKVAEGMAQVEAEEAKANAEAKRHNDEGKQKAEQEKQKGEKEAADAKERARHKSSGFWGWVSSKAKAAVAGIKKAVSSAIDACRRAVKAVIDAAKKLAMAAIDLARKAINALIEAIGQALIAISEVLLAAFPALKARFQGAIRKAVGRATAAVNKLADGLKQAVQKALDKLGAALDKALQFFEKAINAIIDIASAVVQGAIKAAQAVVEALGTWAKLIKDIATGPGAWLGKLGAAIVDGIKNHLWAAFKTTAIEWLKSKVFELLGIGGIVLQLLLDGGLTKDAIIQMALDALVVAIPAALVAILIEKLVAMIVPAAGALMAIIEGLQAAWGTVSRIIAAFAAFMAFLLAVKGGTAGALFAAVLASAAVVVLDFVSHWLLKKLASAARKVGAKLKGLAEKFKSKRRRNAEPTTHHDVHEAKAPNTHDHHGDRDAKNKGKEETAAQKQVRLEAAVSEVKGLMAKRQRLSLLLRARLALIRRKHKLDRLEAERKGSANVWHVFAKINPEARFDLFSIEDDASDLRQAVRAQLASLPPTASIADVRQLCSKAAAAHMAPGYKLDWKHLRDSWVLFLERPGHEILRTAVGEFWKANKYIEIARTGNQILFRDVDGKEYVHDSIGQYVPRHLTRNISEEDRKALRKKKAMQQTGPRTRVEVWEHVAGAKPSPYISTTKVDSGRIENPHGQPLGGEYGRVRIDLFKIPSKVIFDVTTKKGQDQWKLSYPKKLIQRRAIEDAVRTQEVLIKSEIPYDAVEQL